MPPSLSDLLAPSTLSPPPPIQSLAYIGDVVYELLTRTTLLYPLKKTSDYHSQVVKKVRAEEQSRMLGLITREEGAEGAPSWLPLSPSEIQIIRRGRNSVKSQPSRFSTDKGVYQDATSLECLIGYLYLEGCDEERFRTVAGWIKERIAEDN